MPIPAPDCLPNPGYVNRRFSYSRLTETTRSHQHYVWTANKILVEVTKVTEKLSAIKVSIGSGKEWRNVEEKPIQSSYTDQFTRSHE